MTNSAPDRHLELSPEQISQNELVAGSWWQRQSIRFKTTVLAIALGTIPTLILGSVAYCLVANSIQQQSAALRKSLAVDLQNQVNVFMRDRFNDIQMMATLPIFTDARLRSIATSADLSAALQKIQDAYDIYNSIAVFDAQGDFIAKTDGKSLGNHLNRSYIQAALKADGAVISQPVISTSSGVFSIYTAAPIKDKVTGEMIGFIRARMPVEVLKDLLQDYSSSGNQYYLLNNQGEIFLGSNGEYIVKTKSDSSQATDQDYTYEAIDASAVFANANDLLNSSNVAAKISMNNQTNTEQFLTYVPAQESGLPPLNWQTILATDTAIIFAPQAKLRLIFMLGTGLVALGLGAIAYVLAGRMLQPLLQATAAVKKIGQGDFATRLPLTGSDEIAQLSKDINSMAVQLTDLVQTQTLFAQQSEALTNITLRLANASVPAEIYQVAVSQSYHSLNPQGVIYFQLDHQQTGTVVAESFAPNYVSYLHQAIFDSDLVAQYYWRHQQGMSVEVINDVAQVELLTLQQQLNSLAIPACIIAPVVIEDHLAGLLIIHQSSPVVWQDREVEFVTQVANQISFAVTRLELLTQQQLGEAREKSAKEQMQRRALSLLQEVYDVAEGDLTIRAKVTEDEIGTIADSYNSTIESLQKLVNQTKAAAVEVQNNTLANDLAVQSLAEETIIQSTAIEQMLEQVKGMEQSIHLVATQADQAEEFVKQASLTIDLGDRAMNRTVAEINTVQDTIAQTVIKAEKLGESSLEISQAVNLITRFAAQTRLLALKASIEAARAGDKGKGFAVIADEVRSLATQSAEASAEIETLVSKIQLETSEVVVAMNQGSAQIASGSELAQQTRHSLTQANQASQKIRQLVGSITQATQHQSATSAQVSQTIFDVAAIAERNSQSATKLTSSIHQLSEIATELQTGIAKFKT